MSGLALKVYLAKAKDKCKELLFISYKDGHKGDLYKNTFFGWVRKLTDHVYKTAEGEVLPLANAITHEVCTLAASLAFWGSVDMLDILLACLWASNLTVTDFFLWDIAFLASTALDLLPLLYHGQDKVFNLYGVLCPFYLC